MDIAEAYSQIRADEDRVTVGWSADIIDAHKRLDDCGGDTQEMAATIGAWLGRQQPCVFGRMAANQQRLAFCVLTEADILGGDRAVQDKIQEHRLRWRHAAADGDQSGFLILALTDRLRSALPDRSLGEFARLLCGRYLLKSVQIDTVELEDVCLRMPGREARILQWRAGVNVFASAADRRWWHDHRIPGGLAFSVNSVGHLVQSSRVAGALQALQSDAGVVLDDGVPSTIDSLPTALRVAMQTIGNAATIDGRLATRLCPLSEGASPAAYRGEPVDLRKWSVYDPRRYEGDYHTDHTVPSTYFTPAWKRPNWPIFDLDFTYLWSADEGGDEYFTMGEGIPIADDAGRPSPKADRVHGTQISEKEFLRYLDGG